MLSHIQRHSPYVVVNVISPGHILRCILVTCTSQILTSIVICIRINVLDMIRHSKWRTREVAFPMCLPTTLRILNPANLFCNMQCTTVCITAAGSRVAKRTPGMCPGGLPQRVCATSPSVDHRGAIVGDPSGVESVSYTHLTLPTKRNV